MISISLGDSCLLFLVDDFTTTATKHGRYALLHEVEVIRTEISTGRVFGHDTHLATLSRSCCYNQSIRIRLTGCTESNTRRTEGRSYTIKVQVNCGLRQWEERILTISLRAQQATLFGCHGHKHNGATGLDRQLLELFGQQHQSCCTRCVVACTIINTITVDSLTDTEVIPMGSTYDVFILQVGARKNSNHVMRFAYNHILHVHCHLALGLHGEALEARLLGCSCHFLEIHAAHFEQLLGCFFVQPSLESQGIRIQIVRTKADVVLDM